LNGASSLSDLAGAATATQETYDEKMTEDVSTADGKGIDWIQAAREAVLSKGQSKRIWNELYKVRFPTDPPNFRLLTPRMWSSMSSMPVILWERDVER
jgi:hypothetical protein